MDKKYNIMVVDDNITNLQVAKQALADDFNVFPVTSGEKALLLLDKVKPDMMLLDIKMPGLSGFDVLKLMKNNIETRNIPVIFLTSIKNNGNELEGLELGAVDYITKPFSKPLLLKRVRMHIALFNYTHYLEKIIAEKTDIIMELQQAIVYTVSDLIERRDGSTGGHVTRTQAYIKVMLDALFETDYYHENHPGYSRDMVVKAAQLHDVGKIGIPDYVLLKPGRFTTEEYETMKRHVTIGVEALSSSIELTREKEFLGCAVVLAENHHEKWNGQGYPRGLSGKDIPMLGRIMAIADVYDALTSARPYKEAFSHEKAVEIVRAESGEHFDPVLVDVFLAVEDKFRQISEGMVAVSPFKEMKRS